MASTCVLFVRLGQRWQTNLVLMLFAANMFTREERAEIVLADRLKDEIEEANPLAGTCTMYSDILTANLREIDYIEIAHNWLEDVDKDEEDEETTKGGDE